MTTNRPYYIVGADLSLSKSGLCEYQLLPDSDPVHNSTALVPGKLKGPERLEFLRDSFLQWIRGSDLIVIEDYAFGGSGKMTGIAEWGGIARLAAYEEKITILTVFPTTLKKFVCGGKAEKNQMMLEAYKKWGVEFKSDDECDPFCLAKVGELWAASQGILQLDRELTKIETEVLAKVSVYHDAGN